jgi:DNA-binding MarR family transcriptional regulator
MRAIRLAMGKLDAPALTVPQFRALHFVNTHKGPSLSATAEFLGLTLPSTSKLVDQLVRRGILSRGDDASDRRRMTLRLTSRGDALLASARDVVSGELASLLEHAADAELSALRNALMALQHTWPMPTRTESTGGGNVAEQTPAGEPALRA